MSLFQAWGKVFSVGRPTGDGGRICTNENNGDKLYFTEEEIEYFTAPAPRSPGRISDEDWEPNQGSTVYKIGRADV